MASEEKFKEGVTSYTRRLMTDLGIMRDKGYDLLAYGTLKFDEAQIKNTMADMWKYMDKLSDNLKRIEEVINDAKSEKSNP